MEHFLKGSAPLRAAQQVHEPKGEESQIQIFSSELTYLRLNRSLPSRKCSIKVHSKC